MRTLVVPIAAMLSICLPGMAATSQPQELRCEYRHNPLGISTTAPRLSWILMAADQNARGLRQTAYRVVVASTSANLLADKGDLWDTGKVSSGESIQVPYAGKPLASGAEAFWKVQIWDEAGQPSAWSQPARWSAALAKEDWRARWIGRDDTQPYREEGSSFGILTASHWIRGKNLQSKWHIGDLGSVEQAIAVVGTDPGFELFINNKLVGHGVNVHSPEIWEVSRYLKSGTNTINIVPDASKNPVATIAGFRLIRKGKNPADLHSNGDWKDADDLGPYGMQPWGEVGFDEARALPARLLRKEFAAEKQVARATAYVSGLGLFELYLNGSKVGDHVLSPNLTDYDKHVQFVTFDVTGQIKSGANAVGLMLGNGRYWAPRLKFPIATRTFGYPKAIVQIELEYQDGSRSRVVSDSSWKLTTAGPIRSNNEYDGEHYDARAEQRGWAEPGFAASGWEPVSLVQAAAGELVPQEAEPLRVVETIKPVSIKEVRPGLFLYDLGQNMVGWCRIHVAGKKGDTITLRHAETLTDDGELYTANLRSARATDTYIVKGEGEETYEPRFTYHGFRYVEVRGRLRSLEGRVVHDNMEQTADFTSSDTMLNQIHHNVFWGVRSNYRSIPTDCPQRDERQGWLGDRSVVCRSESYLFHVASFYNKWERDLSDSQKPDGAIPDVAPNFWMIYNDDVTWPSTFLQIPSMLYDQYADVRVMQQYYPALQKWIAHTRTYLKDGILTKDTYADWCVPPENPKLIHSQDPARRTDGALLSTAYFYWMNHQMARFARLLGKENEAVDYDQAADELKAAFNRTYYHPESGFYGNGTQTANTLPLAFGMVDEANRQRVFDSLIDNIEHRSNGHVATGLVGAQWLMRTLSENGRPDVAFQIATQPTYPGWGYMVTQGATTVWELWNGNTADPAMNSGNHVMQIGDLGLWMYEDLAGIRADPEHPGFRHVLIHPYPVPKLEWVRASHKSPYGLIQSEWKRTSAGLQLAVTIPANTTATIWVPAKDANSVHEESGKVVEFVRMDGNAAVYDVGSGTYRFTAPAGL